MRSQKIKDSGNERVFITERGATFGYHNLVVDMRAFPLMRGLGVPVVFDVTHSLQLPGAGDGVTAGQAEFIEPLASAGVAAGVDGVFLEIHEEPSRAKSDAQNALRLDKLAPLLDRLVRLDAIVRDRAAVTAARPRRRDSPVMISPPENRASTSLDLARKVLEIEAAAILGLLQCLDHRFEQAVDFVAGCRGRVIVTGMGKSGIICRKIAATLTSTGTPAFFLHPADAIHGDLGALQAEDVVIALSHSGETEEVLRVLETIRRIGARLIALTGTTDSTLGQAADVVLDCHVNEEACPLNLAPTASTTAALALGDALAMSVLVRKGFKEEDFANLHPGGKLGKRLMRAEALMHGGDLLPRVGLDALMHDVIYEMSRKGLGMTCVLEGDGRLAGIITDGDLRRHMSTMPDIMERTARDVMTTRPVTISGTMLAVEALKILEERKISALIVVNDDRVAGVLHLHDLWRTEMF